MTSNVRLNRMMIDRFLRARCSFGSLICGVQYVGQGGGDHGDGFFWIHLVPSALGCLAVFGVETPEGAALRAPRTIARATLGEGKFEFDWKKSLSPMELARLKSGFVRSQMTLAPHYDRAHNFSPAQAALLRWLESQLT